MVVNTNADGRISLGIYAAGDLFQGSGTVVSLSFEILGSMYDSSVLTFTRFDCNESPVSDGYDEQHFPAPASGGFYMNGTVSQRISLSIVTEYDPDGTPLSRYDLNRDGRVGVEDAILALDHDDLKEAIRALQYVVK